MKEGELTQDKLAQLETKSGKVHASSTVKPASVKATSIKSGIT